MPVRTIQLYLLLTTVGIRAAALGGHGLPAADSYTGMGAQGNNNALVMKFKTTLGPLLLAMGMAACSVAQVPQPNPYFKLLQATAQDWVSGVRGGGRGTQYRLRIQLLTDDALTFDSVWVAGKQLPVQTEKEGDTPPGKNAVITLLAAYNKSGPDRAGKQEEPLPDAAAGTAKAPVAYKGAALLRYRVNGAEKYFDVPHFTVLSPIHGQ